MKNMLTILSIYTTLAGALLASAAALAHPGPPRRGAQVVAASPHRREDSVRPHPEGGRPHRGGGAVHVLGLRPDRPMALRRLLGRLQRLPEPRSLRRCELAHPLLRPRRLRGPAREHRGLLTSLNENAGPTLLGSVRRFHFSDPLLWDGFNRVPRTVVVNLQVCLGGGHLFEPNVSILWSRSVRRGRGELKEFLDLDTG